jgi:hypothetical protein
MSVINRIEHTPRPNILFAAVQYLMSISDAPDLSRFYPNHTVNPFPVREVDQSFTSFVLANEEDVVSIGRTRYTQTNECRRCVALLPGLMEAPFKSFHLVDVGTSAGLNLGVDRYRYDWGDVQWGPSSGLLLETEMRGSAPLLHEIEVLGRFGLDLNPIDPANPEDRAWLDALIWPEHHRRRERLRLALDMVTDLAVDFVPGDALVTLSKVLDQLDHGAPVVMMNSFALNQFSPSQRAEIDEVVDTARKDRPVHRVSYEVLDKSDDWARLSVDDGTGWREIGQGHPHGEWIELYARP